MEILQNPYRNIGLNVEILRNMPAPSTDASQVQTLLARCPSAAVTPLVQAVEMATDLDVGQISIKDERARMGLGSFKALGASYVIAYSALVEGQDQSQKTYATASAGNHGLSVAAGAKAFGAASVVFISETVPEAFAQRLAAQGAQVMRAGKTYEQSMAAAQDAARDNGWSLLSDSSWPGYFEPSHRLMEGYTALMAEADGQMQAPSHIFLQAGVGGLAGAAAAMARKLWGQDSLIVVVEPSHAAALHGCIIAGDFITATGLDSAMGRLDCKEASLIALKGLARDADVFALITEAEGQAGADYAATHAMKSTASGAAGLAGLLASQSHRAALKLDRSSHVMLIMSEGPE
ncbi:MAG: pyridoxal-phosphate dependent enzyme [Planktomarina sp.]|jgi:diaminopropionate ammonia-lyase|nr:pyridoxal-phosphate dependent enzyme [Planktomarina sp.]MDT2057761.1 pyridoxal-phosphate dependent enzyme [Planktomarina sp.]|tara:strand:- start:14475 stop:15521 length:1047 start_codon:yes stop_codon:yes gene_type:complete